MAIVVDPLRSSEARGKVGALSYNTWRGRHTVKTCGIPGNQLTAARIEARRKLIYWSQQWQLLDSAIRAAFEAYAATHPRPDWTGQPLRLTGHQLYVGSRVQVERTGEAGLAYPWEYPPPDPLLTFSAEAEPATGYVTFFWSHVRMLPDYYIDIWDSGTVSAGRNPSIKESKAFLLLPIDQQPSYDNLIPWGWHVFHARAIDGKTGIVSAWLQFREEC